MKKLSIIIPTLNEEDFIVQTVMALMEGSKSQAQILVIDGGSHDQTVPLLSKMEGVELVVRPDLIGKKYAALNEGAHLATGDVLLFLDADTIVPKNFDKLIAEKISSGAVGGAFQMKFDRTNLILRFIRFVNELRYRLTHEFFGDQGVFCTRAAFENVGGFPASPIMESAHFCRGLKKVGKLALIQEPVITSSRRFFEGGILKVFWQDTHIYLRDLLGWSNRSNGHQYWQVNAKVSAQSGDR